MEEQKKQRIKRGGLTKRGGAWVMRCKVNGRVHWETFKSLPVARARLRELEAERARQRINNESGVKKSVVVDNKVISFLDRWLAAREAVARVQRAKMISLTNYDRPVVKAFMKYCESRHISKLSQLRPNTMHGFVDYSAEQGCGLSTTAGRLRLLKKVFNDAIASGNMAANPLIHPGAPVIDVPENLAKAEAKFLSVEDTEKLYGGMTGDMQLILAIGLEAAARIGEALHVTVADVDFKSGLLHFRNHPEHGHYTKNRKERSYPMNSRLTFLMRVACEGRGPGDVVICDHDGIPLDRVSASKKFTRIAARLGVKTSPHALRHTALSRLAAQGAGVARLMSLSGHKTSKACEVYLHSSRDLERDVVLRAEAAFKAAPGEKAAERPARAVKRA